MIDRFERFVLYINQIYRCIQKIKSSEMGELGLKGTHVMCMLNLYQRPAGLTAAQLADLCMEDRAAISRAVAKLDEYELVYVEMPETGRKYRSRIYLTGEGKIIVRHIIRVIEDVMERGGQGLSAEERRTMYRSLRIIAGNLQKICEEEGEIL